MEYKSSKRESGLCAWGHDMENAQYEAPNLIKSLNGQIILYKGNYVRFFTQCERKKCSGRD